MVNKEEATSCPYCGKECYADFTDVGVALVQSGPYFCSNCHASEIGPYDKPRILSEEEKEKGWYAPHSEPRSSANIIQGRIVTHEGMKEVYIDKFWSNAEWRDDGAVERWFKEIRKPVENGDEQ